MIEFLWFIVLVVTMVGISTARTRSMKRRLWGVLGVIAVVTAWYLWERGPLRALLNLLLFFEWHPVLMTVLLMLSVGALIFAWRGQWSGRAVAGGALLAGGVVLLIVMEWYSTLVVLITLGALGLLWFSRAASAILGWKFILMIVLLATGLFVTYLIHAEMQDYTTFGLTLGVSFVLLLVAWSLGRRILASVFATIIVVVSGGLLLLKLGKPVPHIIDTIGDYVVFGLIVMCAYAAIKWVRRAPQLQPLGWASALMIAFLGTGLFLSSYLYGEPQDFAEIEDQFKYGSIGSDHFLARGIPYYIWEVLPKEFPPEDILMGNILPHEGFNKEDYRPLYGKEDKRKRGYSYEAFGLIKEENKKVLLVGQTEEKEIDRPIGLSKRTVFGLDFAGINCAFCHASTIQAHRKSLHQDVVLGMPANTVDIELFFQYLFEVAEDPEFTSGNIFSAVLQGNFGNITNAIVNMENRPDKIMNAILDKHRDMEIGRPVFERGFWGICQEIRNSFHRMAYRFVLIPLTWRYVTWLKEDFNFIDPENENHFPRFGPGRVDAWNPGKRTLVKPPLPAEPAGTIDYMSIWNLKPRNGMRFHWDGNTNDVDERTIVAGLFVNGPNIETLDVTRVKRVIDWLNERPAPRFDDFAPKTDLGDYGDHKRLGELVERRKQGRIVFQHWCASCHAPDGDRIGRIEPIAELGTDPKRIEAFTTELQNALNTIERKARKKGDTWKLTKFRKQNGYANMLLDGIWLRAPYLHNGSVPTLRDLLNKPKCRPNEAPDKGKCEPDESKARPETFCRGIDVYDWRKAGFVSSTGNQNCVGSQGETFFLYDTRIEDNKNQGNSNQGHLYGIDLGDDDKENLVEFLKSL